MRFFRKAERLAGAAALLLTLTSCSPSVFFGKDTDPGVKNASSYRKINTACAGMQISSSTIDAPTARTLLNCFNAYGALDPVVKLMNRLSDDELAPLVDLANRQILSDKKTLFEIDSTYRTLEQKGILDNTIRQFGRVIENEEFVSAAIAALKDKYDSPERGEILAALEELSGKFSDGGVASGLDVGITVSETRAFSSFLSRLGGPSPSSRDLRAITDSLGLYLKSGDPQGVDAGRELLHAIVEMPLLEALDQVAGRSEDELRKGVPRLASFLSATLSNDGRLMDRLASLQHYTYKRPIACLGGSKRVEDGALFLVREIVTDPAQNAEAYVHGKGLMTLVAMNPFCSYPPALGMYYPALSELADTNAIQPTADLLKALYSYEGRGANGAIKHPMAELLIRILADTGSGLDGVPENTAGIKRLIPALAEIQDRQAIEDLLLLASLPRVEDRAPLRDTLADLLQPVPRLGGKSLVDVLTDAVATTSPEHLYQLVYSMRRYVTLDEPILAPALRALRSAYYVNDAHPFVRVAKNTFGEATRNEKLYATLFKIAEMPEFLDTVRLFSTMAKDGRVKDLLGTIVSLFHRYAMAGQEPIHPVTEPVFVAKRRHDLAAEDLIAYPLRVNSSGDDPCHRLDLNVSMADWHDPRFASQVTNLLGCLNKDGSRGDLVAAVNFLRNSKVDDGRDLFELNIDLVRSLGLDAGQQAYLLDSAFSAVSDGRMDRLLKGLPMWLNRPVRTSSADPANASVKGFVLEPLIRLAAPVMAKARASLGQLESTAASILRRADAISLLRYGDKLWQKKPEPSPKEDPQDYDLGAISHAVEAVECVAPPAAKIRSQDIIQEYRNAVTGQDRPNGLPHFSWGFDELHTSVDQLFEKLRRPDARDPSNRKVLDAMLGYLRYFTLEPGQKPNRQQHYTPDALLKWLHDRSTDYKVITYYYPGENTPRVRLVNSLDRMDLVLTNADFNAPIIGTNFGIGFLIKIAQAWGDEPWDRWPDEIRAKFPNGDSPKLSDVVDEIEKTQKTFEGIVGFPSRTSCDGGTVGGGGWLPGVDWMKPHLYNIHQLQSVLRENVNNGGLKVLRDLFYEIYASTPERFREATSDDNNLVVIMRSIQMGVFRQLGRTLMLYGEGDPNYPALSDVFRTVVHSSVSPDMPKVAATFVLHDEAHALFWSLTRQIYDALGDVDGAPYLKQSGFYLLALGEQMGLLDSFLHTTSILLNENENYLIGRADILGGLLKSKRMAYLTRALYQDRDVDSKLRLSELTNELLSDSSNGRSAMAVFRSVDEDPQARQNWNLFLDRADALTQLSEYQALHLDDLGREALDFIEEGSSDPRGIAVARRLRFWTAERLESRDFEAFLQAAQRDPDGFNRMLQAFGRAAQDGDIRYLLDFARRALQ